MSSHTAFNHYGAIHVMCLLWNKRLGFSHHEALHIFCSETTSYWTSMQSFGRTILHYAGWLLPFFIITFVSRLSETFLHPFQKREPNSKCLTCPCRFNLQHQIMFNVNVVGWNARVEIVPHNFFGSWNRSHYVFWNVELVPKFFWVLEFHLKQKA